MRTQSAVPSRRVLAYAQATNERVGHENLGFLSESRGFLPQETPVRALPPSHKSWDDVAARLPELFRNLTLRPALDAMPVLGASEEELADRYVLRASVILGIFAHAHYYVQTDPPEAIPPSITTPWHEVSRRLQRPAPHLSFIDMNAYNWRLLHDGVASPIRVENLTLLIPIVGNEDERRFQMSPVEAMARLAPTVGAAVRAQEALARDDVSALKRELVVMADAVHDMTAIAIAKVNPNRYSSTYVDPVVWGKTVAPLATPYDPNVPGPSGTAIPSFQLLDVFFGRRTYATAIGHETDRARGWFPPHWKQFLSALDVVSVPQYVQRRGNRALQGLFREGLEAYVGDTGMLGRHRMKTYGYLDLSFKAGRTRTLGGFGGGFADRIWDRTDGELERARRERYYTQPETWHHVSVKDCRPLREDAAGWVGNVVFDVEGAGIRHPAGSRCAVLPENRSELVERTLRSLRAEGDEIVELDRPWRDAVLARDGYQGANVLPLRTFLRFGRIRPVDRPVAKLLLGITGDTWLSHVVERRAEDQWELWELLEVLAGRGFNPRQLWKAHTGERDSICHIVPPERSRLYSISSAMEDGTEEAREMHLTFARLRYETEASEVSREGTRLGTASAFLSSASVTEPRHRVPIKIVRTPRFPPPADPSRPIILFAGGTGIAPFRSMLHERRRQSGAGETWLFFATRTRADLHHGDELADLVKDGALQLRVAFSREDSRLVAAASVVDGQLALESGPRQHIGDEIARDENARRLWDLISHEGASVYVCGRADFSLAVMEAIRVVLARFSDGTEPERQANAQELVRRLVGENRFLQEVYTTYTGPAYTRQNSFDASEVVVRNNERNGYWVIINGRVYDLTDFAAMHPGGDKIIRSYAGMDATLPYQKVLHDVNPEVDAMLAMYELGVVRRLDLGPAWSVAIGESGGLELVTVKDLYRTWISFLYTVVEMENAGVNDFGVRREPLTYDEAASGDVCQSPYKTQLLLQAHHRFRRDYLAAVTGPTLSRLWALTAAIDGSHHPVRWMESRVAALQGSGDAAAAAAMEERTGSTLEAGTDLAWVVAVVERIEAEDKRFILEMKEGLRAGVRLFERFERDTFAFAASDLRTAVEALPQIFERYLAAMARLAATLSGEG